MIKLARRFFDSRAHIIASIPADNDYLVIRHRLFVKLLDISTMLLFIGSAVYLFLNIDSMLQLNGAVPLVLLALAIAVNFIYLKTASLPIAGAIISITIYLAFAIPAFTHVIAINYPTYFLLLLPMLALLILGRSVLLITALISIASTIAIVYLHDADSYSVKIIATDDRTTIVVGGFYILSYILIIYACSAYEKIIADNKKQILITRKELVLKSKLDPLLGIYSRKALISNFNKLKAQSNPLAQKVTIIALTLNGLRELNLEYGQNFANDVLLTITARMNFELGKKDIIGRISGHEFVIIKMTNNSKTITAFFNKLLKYICEPVSFDGHTTEINIAAGYTIYNKNLDSFLEQLNAVNMRIYDKQIVEDGLL
ncbi:MAG: diguanylate cyclase (GGDEF)-like protein [Pseudomonadales bacterium]|jgi:diguanylate cyclase (GGDEF)-like protein